MLLDLAHDSRRQARHDTGTTLRDSLYRIAALARHNTVIRLRDPGQTISYLVMPMVLMLVLKPIYERAIESGPTQAVTGLLVMFSVFAIAIAGNSVMIERTWRTWDRMRVSQASSTELLIGKVVPIFILMVAQQTILLVYGCLVIGLPVPGQPLLVAASVFIWAFALLSIAALLASVVRSQGELSMICDVGALTLSSIGGSFVPLALMPDWAQVLAHFSPGYYALVMLQAAVREDVGGMVMPAAVLLVLGLVTGAFAARKIARGWGRSRLI
jgi:ABC-2 type transport system permease protein